MNKIQFYLLNIIAIIVSIQAKAQDTIVGQANPIFKTSFKDMVVKDHQIFGITNGDSLLIYDVKTHSGKYTNYRFGQIEITQDGDFYATDNKFLWHSKNGLKWRIHKTPKFRKHNLGYNYLLLDEEEDPLIITNQFLFVKGNIIRPKKKYDGYLISLRKGRLIVPEYAVCLNNFVFMTTSLGEFGYYTLWYDIKASKFLEYKNLDYVDDESHNYLRSIQYVKKDSILQSKYPSYYTTIDNTTFKKFPYDFSSSNLRSMAQDKDGNAILKQSMHHITLDGNITFLEFRKDIWYKETSLDHLILYFDNDNIGFKEVAEYLGPIAYNSYSNNFISFSSSGFSTIKKEGEKFTRKTLFVPRIKWLFGQANALGYQMSVDQIHAMDENEFAFLTKYNGIGYFNGERLFFYN